MKDLSKKLELNDELIFHILMHFKRFGVDYSKSVGRDLEMNKRDVCELLRKLYEMGLLEKRRSGMLKRKEARLKKRVTTHPHHTYYQLSEKGEEYLKNLMDRYNKDY